MSVVRLSSILIAVILMTEFGVLGWWRSELEASTGAVFSYLPAATNSDQPDRHAEAIAMYGADRGGEYHLERSDGIRLNVVQLDWDRVETGPLMELSTHAPEICQETSGFKLQAVMPPRTHPVAGQSPLIFDSTHFTDPSGRSVYIFKMPWIQGVGSWHLREDQNRLARLKSSFIRRVGQARMLQAGVFGARDADHAWQVFQSEVLEKLEWRD